MNTRVAVVVSTLQHVFVSAFAIPVARTVVGTHGGGKVNVSASAFLYPFVFCPVVSGALIRFNHIGLVRNKMLVVNTINSLYGF